VYTVRAAALRPEPNVKRGPNSHRATPAGTLALPLIRFRVLGHAQSLSETLYAAYIRILFFLALTYAPRFTEPRGYCKSFILIGL
jgi:hypothetical protein